MKKFYDGSELLSRSKYNIFISLGGRNIGKSTFWQRYIIRKFIKKKEKFIIIVKYDNDLENDGFAANYFSDSWMEKWYKDFEIVYSKKKYFIRNKKDKKDEEDKKSGWQLAGYAVALNKNASLKSTTTFQDATNILFEEFMPLENKYIGSKREPEKEPKLLASVYQTIARGEKGKQTRKCRLILISNNYTFNNPYFTYFKILKMVTENPNSIFQRFYEYNDSKLHYALEFSQYEPEIIGIEADDEALGIRFQDFRNDLRITKDKPKKILFQLTFDEKTILNIAQYNEALIVFQTKNTIQDSDVICYSCSMFKNKKAFSIRVFKNREISRILINLYEKNLLYYDKLDTFINLTNILAF